MNSSLQFHSMAYCDLSCSDSTWIVYFVFIFSTTLIYSFTPFTFFCTTYIFLHHSYFLLHHSYFLLHHLYFLLHHLYSGNTSIFLHHLYFLCTIFSVQLNNGLLLKCRLTVCVNFETLFSVRICSFWIILAAW